MPWLRSRRSLRFIVGDQHNSTSTTRKLGFGPGKHGALTGLAQRASQPSGGSLTLTSNREASPPSPRPRWTVNHLWLMTSLARNDAPCVKSGKNSPHTRANHRSSGASTTRKRGSTPAFRCTTRVLGWDDAFSSKGNLRQRRPSLAWLDFPREHAVARAQHPKSGRTAGSGHPK